MDNKKEKKEQEQVKEENEEKLAEDVIETSGEMDVLSQKVQEADDKYKRALADYQNLVRRTQDEKQEWARLSNKQLLLKILPILDTLMLAEKHTKDQNFVLTVQQFLSTLQEEGVTRIKTVGEKFNPHLMEAVTTQEGEEGKVLEEVRAGYMYIETVLRPAQVIVGAKGN